MARSVLVLLCAVLCASSAFALNTQTCQTSFNSTFAAATTGTQRCTAYNEFGSCLTTVIASTDASGLALVLQTAGQMINIAVAMNTDCDLTTVPYLAAVNGQVGNIAFSLAQGQNVVLPALQRKDAGVHNVNERLAAILRMRDDIVNRVGVDTEAADAALVQAASHYTNIIYNVVDANYVDLNQRLASLPASVASIRSTIDVDIPTSVSSASASLAAQLATEATARAAMSAPLASLLTTIDAVVQPSLSTLVADRSAIRAVKTTNTIYATISSQVSSALSTEITRSASKAVYLSTSMSTIKTTISTSLSTGVKSEAVRADATCSTAAAAMSFRLIDNNGADDYQKCTTAQAGALYYSRVRKTVLMCNGAFISAVNVIAPAFVSSTILTTTTLRNAMISRVGSTSLWARCYVGSVDGFSASIIKAKCSNKGATLSIVTASGRIWGGFVETPWTGRSAWSWSMNAWLYRFNGNTLENAPIYASTSYWPNAMYDEPSYCMAYGSGHDFYVDSGCRNGYTATPSTYQGVSNSWLAGSYSSWTLSDVEMYYRLN